MPTFGEVAEQFRASYVLYGSESRSTIIGYQVRVLKKHLGERRFEDVGRNELEEFFRSRRAAGIAASTLNHDRIVLSLLYGWALERGLCTENPIRKIRKFRVVKTQGR